MAEHEAADILNTYEHLAEVTGRMREAAVVEDWDKVIALESECAGLYRELMQQTTDEGPRDSGYQRRKSELICRLLEDDAQIRARVSGQLNRIWQLIEGEKHTAKLSSAYGAVGGLSEGERTRD